MENTFFKTRISIYKNYNCDFKTQLVQKYKNYIILLDVRGYDFEDIKISIN